MHLRAPTVLSLACVLAHCLDTAAGQALPPLGGAISKGWKSITPGKPTSPYERLEAVESHGKAGIEHGAPPTSHGAEEREHEASLRRLPALEREHEAAERRPPPLEREKEASERRPPPPERESDTTSATRPSDHGGSSSLVVADTARMLPNFLLRAPVGLSAVDAIRWHDKQFFKLDIQPPPAIAALPFSRLIKDQGKEAEGKPKLPEPLSIEEYESAYGRLMEYTWDIVKSRLNGLEGAERKAELKRIRTEFEEDNAKQQEKVEKMGVSSSVINDFQNTVMSKNLRDTFGV